MKILIIDDNQQQVLMLRSILEHEGYETASACNGEDGLNKAKEEIPDMVILDLGLPKLSGEQVCKEIRKDEKTKSVAVVMLSGKTSDADRIIGRVIGADYYLTKPCDINELLRVTHTVQTRNDYQ